MKKEILVVGVILILMALVYADNQPTGATLTIGNTAPKITSVHAVDNVGLTSGTTKTIYVFFNVSDAEGYADVNVSSAIVNLNKTGETTRTSTSCTSLNETGNDIIINCSIDMYFYDAQGSWDINATINDNTEENAENITRALTVSALDSISLNDSSLSFGNPASGEADVKGDVELIINFGNSDYTVMQVKGQNLTGAVNGYNISATTFSVNNLDSAAGEALVENADVTVVSLTLNHGVEANTTMYTYVDVPVIVADTYTTAIDWTITAS